MHSKNIIHRDIKLENVLITDFDDEGCPLVKLADFGFAERLEAGCTLNDCKGSLLYVSPEVLNEEDYDHKIDIWNICLSIFVLLSDSTPY